MRGVSDEVVHVKLFPVEWSRQGACRVLASAHAIPVCV